MKINLVSHEHENERQLEITLPKESVFLKPDQARMLARRFMQWSDEGGFCEDCNVEPCERHI